MAGAGYKLFNTGDVLTAAQVNTYLMQQTVMVFASSAARTSALSGVLAEGMVSYLQDTNTLEVYDGSAWVGATGDITGLTAGTGISISSATGPVPTITNDVATEFDAKGDLVVGTGDNAFDRLPVGNSGETIVADSSATTGLRWQGDYAAGKNKVINGAMQIAQRGTSITIGASGYSLDRYAYSVVSAVPTGTISQQTFTPGAAPVAGYEGSNFMRIDITANNGCTTFNLTNVIEDVRTLAGQTATFSFWAKADGASTLNQVVFSQGFGTGGSATVNTSVSVSPSLALTTGWTRYTATFSVPSISGKTIGTGSSVGLIIQLPKSGSNIRNGTYDFWGWQLEAGNVATAFQTATGNPQGELAVCQRYYQKSYNQATAPASVTADSGEIFIAVSATNTQNRTVVRFSSTMRTAPTVTIYSTNSGTAAKIYNETTTTDLDGVTAQIGDGAFIYRPSSGTTSVGDILRIQWQASAEL